MISSLLLQDSGVSHNWAFYVFKIDAQWIFSESLYFAKYHVRDASHHGIERESA